MNWKKTFITIIILAVVAALLALLVPKDGIYTAVFNANQQAKNGSNGGGTDTQEITLEGQIACLPHRDTSGPTTLECAYGLKGDNGYYYALDTSAYSGLVGSMYEAGDRVRITGTIEELTEANAKQWKIYNIVGSIAVTNYEKL